MTNRLDTLFPAVADEWHPSRNGDLRPSDVTARSNKKAWWLCRVNPCHEWSAVIASRTAGNGCPMCAGKMAAPDFNLATEHPEIASEWHATKNGSRRPESVRPASNVKVWWQCSRTADHVWQAQVQKRTIRQGCPFCAGKKVDASNSLRTVNPELAAQWHPTRNAPLTPAEITAGSSRRVWWKCSSGDDHVWQASVSNRHRKNQGCPACSGRAPSAANNLANSNPTIAAQWHPTRNGDLSPAAVVPGSNRRVWWRCDRGSDHEWRTSVASRTTGAGCPACAGQQVSVTNSLKAKAPEVASLWHPSNNGSLTPEDVTSGSSSKVWWKCPHGRDHEWKAEVHKQTSGRGCPYCSGRRISETNRLTTVAPELARQWHPSRNGAVSPDGLTLNSSRRVWWQCTVNGAHVWEASPNGRRNRDCPFCSVLPRSKQEIRLAFEIAYHLPVAHDTHKIQAGAKLWDVDICIPEALLIIEFDGSYWHRDRASQDRAKARHLRSHGWRVVRVREAPLKKLSKWNIVVEQGANAHEVTTALLVHLQAMADMVIPRLDERLRATGPLRAAAAEAEIARLALVKANQDAQR